MAVSFPMASFLVDGENFATPDRLPVLPLRDVVVFPYVAMPLLAVATGPPPERIAPGVPVPLRIDSVMFVTTAIVSRPPESDAKTWSGGMVTPPTTGLPLPG